MDCKNTGFQTFRKVRLRVFFEYFCGMHLKDLKQFLDEKADIYNHPDFIENDPIQIPHRFSVKQDIEIAGFLTAIISWGNRKSIIKSAEKIIDSMGNSPYDFVQNFEPKDIKKIENKAVHRTFNTDDLQFFLCSLQSIYSQNESLENLFLLNDEETNMYHAIERFRNRFLQFELDHRAKKHISSTYKSSAAKRLVMFLRWMVRKDNRYVDFGIWENIDPKYLSIPLDVHTGNIARKLNLIQRKQNDWKTVEEMDLALRSFDASDPAKYDFALFGLGVSGDF